VLRAENATLRAQVEQANHALAMLQREHAVRGAGTVYFFSPSTHIINMKLSLVCCGRDCKWRSQRGTLRRRTGLPDGFVNCPTNILYYIFLA
jgi:hypothetical protein